MGSVDSVSKSVSYNLQPGRNPPNFGEVSFVSDSKLVGSSMLMPNAVDPYGLLLELSGNASGMNPPARRGQLPPVEQSLTSTSFLQYLDPRKFTPLSSPAKDDTPGSLHRNPSRPLSVPRGQISSQPRDSMVNNLRLSPSRQESLEDSEVVIVPSRPGSRGGRSSAKDIVRASIDSTGSVEQAATTSGAFVINSKTRV